ncbi:MAG: hypothetical protein KAJ18_07850 [Candidatus Omnitrophica bacterium]|nr:hypothetical protein [Candidatus Omnitrophota bacterium]
MRLSKFIQGLVGVTILALIYINMQIQIFDMAYQGKKKEKQLMALSDNNGRVTCNILKLKSSNNLGIKLLDEGSGLKFRDQGSTVHLVTAEVLPEAKEVLSSDKPKKLSSFLRFLPMRKQVEAQAEEKRVVKPWRR